LFDVINNEDCHEIWAIKAKIIRGPLYIVFTVEDTNGKPEGKRPRRRWQDNIKMYLTEMRPG
jgi:hypothetical protein